MPYILFSKEARPCQSVHESTLTPCSVYLQIAQRFSHYLKNDLQQRLFYPKTCTMTLRAFSYIDWDSCAPFQMVSYMLLCVFFFIGVSHVSWNFKRYETVKTNNVEVEYISNANATSNPCLVATLYLWSWFRPRKHNSFM